MPKNIRTPAITLEGSPIGPMPYHCCEDVCGTLLCMKWYLVPLFGT